MLTDEEFTEAEIVVDDCLVSFAQWLLWSSGIPSIPNNFQIGVHSEVKIP